MSGSQIASLLLLAASALTGCVSSTRTLVDPAPEIVRLAKEGDENFCLTVSNQSGSRDPIDMEISIDGKQVASGEFEHGYSHRFTHYLIRLERGAHVLRARTRVGETEREVSFSIEEGAKLFAALDYYYSPGGKSGVPTEAQFQWLVRDEPILQR